MIIPHVRLPKGRKDQVVRDHILSLQEYLRLKLIVRAQLIDPGVVKLQRIHILDKLPFDIMPEDDSVDITSEFGV